MGSNTDPRPLPSFTVSSTAMREQLRFECMRLAAQLPDAHGTADVLKNGEAIFAAVTK